MSNTSTATTTSTNLAVKDDQGHDVKHRSNAAEPSSNTLLAPSKEAIIRSTNIYSVPLTLLIYDYWVLGFVTRFAWRCSTSSYLLPFFRTHLGAPTHLDIGVGTGYYLCNANIPAETTVTLLDLSQDALDKAARRFNRPETTKTVLHDIFEPLPESLGDFDSISMFYLLHCLPGSPAEKCSVFAHLSKRLRPGGCVYGATILGDEANGHGGVYHNAFGRMILNYGHKEGFFCNREDSKGALASELRKYFHEVETKVVGTICMFRGSRPKV